MFAFRSATFYALNLLCFLPESSSLELQKVLGGSIDYEDVNGVSVGVGFDLTASYGIAAVSYPNGTRSTIAKINGAPEYHAMLSRLSLASSTHPTPPYSNLDDMYRDQARQARRRARKVAGLPASEDVAILSTMLRSLREAVEGHLGHSIDSAAATVPHLLALYLEDLHDAFQYIDLECLDLPVRYGLLRETSAAYAGYGFGLCSDYGDRPACKAEQQEAPEDVVMAVLYTTSALTVTLSVIKSAYYLWEPPSRRIEDFSLGGDAKQDNSNEEFYWERLRDRLREIIVMHQYYEKPGRVLLLGESAQDNAFRRILDEALLSVMEELPEMYWEDAANVAALGAAELAKRAPWDPYKLVADSETREAFEVVNDQRDRPGK